MSIMFTKETKPHSIPPHPILDHISIYIYIYTYTYITYESYASPDPSNTLIDGPLHPPPHVSHLPILAGAVRLEAACHVQQRLAPAQSQLPGDAHILQHLGVLGVGPPRWPSQNGGKAMVKPMGFGGKMGVSTQQVTACRFRG